MKKFILLIFILATILTSCGESQLSSSLVYEKNPQYAWGYAEFFGDYYADYANKNNVLSLSLFTDSLKLNSLGELSGLGQYLFLEDVFQAPADTLLQVGTYNVNNTGLPFTVAPGKNDTVDNQVFPIGAYISYYEYITSNSTLKLISRGSFTISRYGSIYTIACDFVTSDSTILKGTFKAELPHIDEALSTQKSGIRKKLVYVR